MATDTFPGAPGGASHKKEFNYCFWAHIAVAIPALPLLALLAASPFTGLADQLLAALIACTAAIAAAVMVEHVPGLRCKIRRWNQPKSS